MGLSYRRGIVVLAVVRDGTARVVYGSADTLTLFVFPDATHRADQSGLTLTRAATRVIDEQQRRSGVLEQPTP